jgi:ABC-2 type transport system ATP-binding protein
LAETILTVENLSKTYNVRKSKPIKAVDCISLEAYPGEILGILGSNGAGKTTTVKMICGLIRPDSGRILINGKDNFKQRSAAMEHISAVLEGNRNIYWRLTVRENLEFFAGLKGKDPRAIKKEIDYYIDFFGLGTKKNETASKLSRGMQQKLAIAVAMITGSELVLLDEPTLGLDVKTSYDIRELLKQIAAENGRTVLLTSHDMNVVQDVCERVIIINNGRIIAQDKVSNLMRLFDVKAFKFVAEGSLSENLKQALAQIPHLSLAEEEMNTVITLNLEETRNFYRVVELLGSENVSLLSINRQEINFEQVFMGILGRSENGGEKMAAL